MASRLELQTLLETITPNVYFQMPPSLSMIYPCIIYRLNDINIKHANNKPYSYQKGYTITVIDQSPDSLLPDILCGFSGIAFDRFYTADNLNHFVFSLYF